MMVIVSGGALVYFSAQQNNNPAQTILRQFSQPSPTPTPHPLSVQSLRDMEFPGSELVIEETLSPGNNYSRYYVSYMSEGLKQYALLTIPIGEKPTSGWPAIVFNHGYIPPGEYKTTERYVAYTDGFSRNGYILIRPDYRGHDRSEGEAAGGYGSNAYTIDVLNALASLRKHPDVDVNRIGMWGHSMGGFITLRSMVVDNNIKAGVIWAGVVVSYPDLINNWRRRTFVPPPSLPTGVTRWRDRLSTEFGTPQENPDFWKLLSSNSYLSDISGPIQLHHGTADDSVPVAFSEQLDKELKTVNKLSDLHIYPQDDHNIGLYFGIAMERSIAFFDEHL